MPLRPLAASLFGSAVLASFAAPAAAAPTDIGTPGPVPVSPATSYVPIGTDVQGGSTVAGGPRLPGPGQYTDEIAHGSETTGFQGASTYYTVELAKGDEPYFSATLIPPQKTSDSTQLEVELTVYDVGESSGCEFHDYDSTYESGGVVSPLSVEVRVDPVGGATWPSECPKSGGAFVVQVTRTGNLFRNQPMPIELGYHLEPPAQTSGLPGPASSISAVPVDLGGAVRPMHAGRSYDNAPVLEPGRYRDAIVSGETRYVRVHLAWGQRMSVLISSTSVAGAGGDGVDAGVFMTNPLRDKLQLAHDSSATTFEFGGSDGGMRAGMSYAVRYTNRSGDDTDVADYSIDGDYFVAIWAGYPAKGTLRIPYNIIVTVTGGAERGPGYQPAVGGNRGGTASASSSSTTVVVSVTAIVVVLAAVAVAVVIVRRRRRRPLHSSPGYALTAPQRQSRP